jgi:hypothetical protein
VISSKNVPKTMILWDLNNMDNRHLRQEEIANKLWTGTRNFQVIWQILTGWLQQRANSSRVEIW